jgi:hypothetical protein
MPLHRTGSTEMQVVVVMPCLNEAELLGASCRSLGFGGSSSAQPKGTTLIVVDNGSTDDTLNVATEIQLNSAPGTVVIAREPERGYVPPRATGNRLASRLAAVRQSEGLQTLILQADADTLYNKTYIEAMCKAAIAADSQTLLEGVAQFSSAADHSIPTYLHLMQTTDQEVFAQIPEAPGADLLCTDAVCAYRLEGYMAWGGHQREFDAGEELFAETTRLRLRCLARNGRKVQVEDALAFPSVRKLVLSPAEQFASAGYPRGERWRVSWRHAYAGPSSAEEFGASRDHPEVQRAIAERQRHLLALFGLLPLHVTRALGLPQVDSSNHQLMRIAASLPRRGRSAVAMQPGCLIADVLEVVDRRPHELDSLLP